MRRGQAYDALRILIAGTISLLLLIILYSVVNISTDFNPSEDQRCQPTWQTKMSTRAVLQTQINGAVLRQAIARSMRDKGFQATSQMLSDKLPSTSLNWFWKINGQSDGKPGLNKDISGLSEAQQLLERTQPIRYTHNGQRINVVMVALDEENPCNT